MLCRRNERKETDEVENNFIKEIIETQKHCILGLSRANNLFPSPKVTYFLFVQPDQKWPLLIVKTQL